MDSPAPIVKVELVPPSWTTVLRIVDRLTIGSEQYTAVKGLLTELERIARIADNEDLEYCIVKSDTLHEMEHLREKAAEGSGGGSSPLYMGESAETWYKQVVEMEHMAAELMKMLLRTHDWSKIPSYAVYSIEQMLSDDDRDAYQNGKWGDV